MFPRTINMVILSVVHLLYLPLDNLHSLIGILDLSSSNNSLSPNSNQHDGNIEGLQYSASEGAITMLEL